MPDEDAERPPKRRRRSTGRSSPRTPLRGRGILRFEHLLDSVDALLQDRSQEDVSVYQIAAHANVPPASAYHFFPTREAAFVALARRYLRGFDDLNRRPIDPAALYSWQGLLTWDIKLAVDYYRSHPAAMKLFLGRYGGLETQQANSNHNARIARGAYARMDAAFHMPRLRDAEAKFHINIEIIDAVLSLSYVATGDIADHFRDEAVATSIAYLRRFLPEQTELRSEHVEAARRCHPIILAATRETASDD